jgi:hypothetical protein
LVTRLPQRSTSSDSVFIGVKTLRLQVLQRTVAQIDM